MYWVVSGNGKDRQQCNSAQKQTNRQLKKIKMKEALIIIIAVSGLALWLYLKFKDQQKIKNAVSNLKDFNSSETYIPSDHGKTSISIDKNGRKICFVDDTRGKGKRTRVYGYKDIYECEILTDGETYLKSSSTRVVAGYIIGGAIGGVAGAVVGGLSGAKTKKENIKSIKLSVRVNDTSKPIFIILFLNKEVKKGDNDYNEAIKTAQYWHALISNFIKQANREEPVAQTQKVINNNLSVSDELLKLNNLKEKGIITAEEFQSQKEKLLS